MDALKSLAQAAITLDEVLKVATIAARGQGTVKFTYTNYRGVTASRLVRTLSFQYGTTDWHKEPCVLYQAWDIEKAAYRTFAVKDIAAGSIVSG